MQMGIQGLAGTQFWDEQLEKELAEGQLSSSAFDSTLSPKNESPDIPPLIHLAISSSSPEESNDHQQSYDFYSQSCPLAKQIVWRGGALPDQSIPDETQQQ
ncbi:hypothetical protein Syun_010775 [Stephania yunnanensis]|uniref:Uncharacterized protein n=1 Tax=Stephania yunnanensis TaxID=152371 RepID=A0AAP0KH44_9MAGN